jgi:hypothetical protein
MTVDVDGKQVAAYFPAGVELPVDRQSFPVLLIEALVDADMPDIVQGIYFGKVGLRLPPTDKFTRVVRQEHRDRGKSTRPRRP